MKIRLPKFLTPRRKYAVDDSKWLVKFGRKQEKNLVFYGRKLGKRGRATGRWFAARGNRAVVVLRWRGFPHEWELTFVSRMKSLEAQGVNLQEVLLSGLPKVIGEAPSDVLLRSVGRKARTQPKTFVKKVNRMFGKSGKKVIVGLNSLDLEHWIEARNRTEDPWKSVVDAIHAADAKPILT